MLPRNLPYALIFSLLLAPAVLVAQSVAINNDGAEPDINAILDLSSKSKGLLIPRLDSNARKAIPKTVGLLVYDTDTHSFWFNNGIEWQNISTGNGWSLGGNSGTSIATNFIGTTDNVPLLIKVNNQFSGLIDPSQANSFWGFRAGEKTTEHSNTAIGAWALTNNIGGTFNTALGSRAMFNDISGRENTAIGAESMLSNTDGNFDTAIGSTSLYSNTSGSKNTAVGFAALLTNSTGSVNTAVGHQSQYFTTTGTANTSIGSESLASNTTGSGNTASGYQAMVFNTVGARNSAYGYRANFRNIDGADNTSIGYEALFENTGGGFNTAVGAGAMRLNTLGEQNTAVGYQALMNNGTGLRNTAIGYGALTSNTFGEANSAIGLSTLRQNTTGSYNVSIGDLSLETNTGGSFNVAVGGASLSNNSSGERNVAIGDRTMDNNITGNNNTAIGYGADVGAGNLTNATAIGANAIVNASNKVRIGNPTVTVIEGQVPFTTPSDGRFKFNVQEDVKGLDFILQLRPVTYQFNVEQYDAQWKNAESKTPVSRKSVNADVTRMNYSEALQLRRTGFIAQEVERAAAASQFNFSGIIKPKSAGEHYSLSYESFVVPLVKAVQEQQEIIRELQQQVAELRLLIKKAN